MFINDLNEVVYEIIEYNTFDFDYIIKNMFDNVIDMVRFFSDNRFNLVWDDICCSTQTYRHPKEKEISPSEIYSIINGAKPLTIEINEEFADGDSSLRIYEVWLK